MMSLTDIPAHLHGYWLVLALAGIGLLTGVLTGLFGVGGGFLAVPMMSVLLGIPYELAVGSSLSFILGTSAGGLARHRRLGNVESRSMVLLGAGAVVGALVGDALQHFLIALCAMPPPLVLCARCAPSALSAPSAVSALSALSAGLAGGQHRLFDMAMDAMFIVLLAATAAMVLRGPRQHRSGRVLLQRLPLGPRVDLPAIGRTGISLTGLVALGLAVGVITGLLGVGGGVFIVPATIAMVGLTPHQAVGTSLGVVLLAALTGTVQKGLQGEVSLWVAMALLAGSAVGVQVGAWACSRLDPPRLRRQFALMVLLAGAIVLADLACALWRQ